MLNGQVFASDGVLRDSLKYASADAIKIAKENIDMTHIRNFDILNYYDVYNDYEHFHCMDKDSAYDAFHRTSHGKIQYTFTNQSHNLYDAIEILSLRSIFDAICSVDTAKIKGSTDIAMKDVYRIPTGIFNTIHNKQGNFTKQDVYLCVDALYHYVSINESNLSILYKSDISIEKIVGKILKADWSSYQNDTSVATPQETLFAQGIYYWTYASAYAKGYSYSDSIKWISKAHCFAASKACFLAMLGAPIQTVNKIIQCSHDNIFACIDENNNQQYDKLKDIDNNIVFKKLIELSDKVAPVLSHCLHAQQNYYDVYSIILSAKEANTASTLDYENLKSKIHGSENSTYTHIRNFMNNITHQAPYLTNNIDFSRKLLTYLPCAANALKCYNTTHKVNACNVMQKSLYQSLNIKDIYIQNDETKAEFMKILGCDTSNHLFTKDGKLNELMNGLISDSITYSNKLKLSIDNYVGIIDSSLNENCIYYIRPNLTNTSSDVILNNVNNFYSSTGKYVNKIRRTIANMVFDKNKITEHNTSDLNQLFEEAAYGVLRSTPESWITQETRFSNKIHTNVKDFVIKSLLFGDAYSGGNSIFKPSNSETVKNWLVAYGKMLNILKDKEYTFPTKSVYRQYVNASIASYNALWDHYNLFDTYNNKPTGFDKMSFVAEKSNLIVKKDNKVTAKITTSEISSDILNHLRFALRYDSSKLYNIDNKNQSLQSIFGNPNKIITLNENAAGLMHINGSSTIGMIEQYYDDKTHLPMLVHASNNSTVDMLSDHYDSNKIPAHMAIFLAQNSKLNIKTNDHHNHSYQKCENKVIYGYKEADNENSNLITHDIKPKVEIASDIRINNVTFDKSVNIGSKGTLTIETAKFQ